MLASYRLLTFFFDSTEGIYDNLKNLYIIVYNIPRWVYNIGGDYVEKEICCIKKTFREEEAKQNLLNRIKRISGQMNGVKKMIENDSYCNDVLIQLSAVENSVRSLSNQLLESHLYSCITRDLKDGKLEAIDEIIDLFKRFNR